MPESREEDGHYFLFDETFQSLKGKTSFKLLGLHADASKPEEKRFGAENGHVVRLSPHCDMVRGTCGSQTFLWPQEFACTAENSNPLPISTLTLLRAHSANRAIILDFGTYFLKVAYLTHTSIQFYSRKVWTDSILGIGKRDRGFHVGLALEFEDYFIAFLSNDLVFQPIWSSSFDKLRNGYIDVCQDYGAFLELVAHWIEERAASSPSRRRLVCEVMRAASDVWFGVGVYTVCEILYMAGVSPFLTEMEVFDNPSRASRICEAFWAYKHKSVSDLPSLLRPCMRDGMLAPTQAQRLSYKSWLHVYAKDTSAITPRMAGLVDLYKLKIEKLAVLNNVWYRYQTSEDSPHIYDVFEPNYLRSSFESKDIHLGELIFGPEEWARYGMKPGKPNALAKMFAREGLLDEPTFLLAESYSNLFEPYDKTIWRHRNTFTYRVPTKQVWSITPCFPENSSIMRTYDKRSKKTIVEVTGHKRHSMLFSTIVSDTRAVAIGPLEYCGNGRVVKLPHGKTLVSTVRHDPSVPQFYAQRELIGLQRKANGLGRSGNAKKSMSGAQKQKRHRIAAKSNALSGSSSPPPDDSNCQLPTTLGTHSLSNRPPVKKRRLSADKALVVSEVGAENIDVDSILLGRRKRKM